MNADTHTAKEDAPLVRFAWLDGGGWLRLAGVIVSALILWRVFPPAAMGSDGVWFALAPLLLVIRHTTPKRAFWFGWLAGTIFWLLSLTWIWRLIWNNGPWPLVVFGHAALALYCALYTALFALVTARVWQMVRRCENLTTRLLAGVVAEPLLWVGAEYLRCVLFTGFAWNPLGAALVDNLPVIQVAALGGVYAVSWLVLLANSAVASLVERLYDTLRHPNATETAYRFSSRLRGLETFLPLVLLVCAILWGQNRRGNWAQQAHTEPTWQVALIQPNAPCIFERGDATEPVVRQTLLDLTAGMAALHPDLVVWPETALIQSLPRDAFAVHLAQDGALAAGAPLLTGAVEYNPGKPPRFADRRFYNAAWLFGSNGVVRGTYHKQHLVPFGEYIPGDSLIPALGRLSPVGFSCTAGEESTIFRIAHRVRSENAELDELAFSPLICFEDTVAPLARQAVRRGARLLVNITNDAWFNGSVEPEQHMAQAVFRCVENGVPMVRAANTGVSCAISPVGQRQVLESGNRTSDFAGALPCVLAVPRQPLTAPYTRWGDWTLARPAALLFLVLLLVREGWMQKTICGESLS